jgi:DNA N-6-adenine-methyltransferase (Dam)
MKNRIPAPSNHWSTPQNFYNKLVDEYGEMYDPCPINDHITSETDNLIREWEKLNFVNPPYSLKEKTNFVSKSIFEWITNGNKTILLLPVSTSTKLFHHVLKRYSSKIEFIEGRIRFEGIAKGYHVNPGTGINAIPNSEHLPKANNSGTFDSMICVIGG